MKRLEIIYKIIEKSPRRSLTNHLKYADSYNLAILCTLDKTYLTEENLDYIIKGQYNEKRRIPFLSQPMSPLVILLMKYPEIINKIPKIVINKINIGDWIIILENQPELFDYCKISDNFSNSAWISILKKQPQLILKHKNPYDKFTSRIFSSFLKNNKEIAKYIDISKIKLCSKSDISYMIGLCPELKNQLDINSKVFNYISKKKPLEENNDIQNDLVESIIKNPELIKQIDIKKIKHKDWVKILSKQPQLIDKCDKLYSMTSKEWFSMIMEQPILEKYNPRSYILNNNQWVKLINIHPQFIDKCNKTISAYNRSKIIAKKPILINKIKFDDITKDDFKNIIYNSGKYRIEVLKKYIKQYYDIEVLTNMINIYPDLKDFYSENDLWKYVDFNKLTNNLEYSILK